MALLADCVGFQAQIASIIELLANSAVVEICKLVDEGYAALRSQMEQERDRSEEEKEALQHKVREMEVKMRSMERRIRRRSQREESSHFLRATEATCANLAVPEAPPLPLTPDDPVFPQPSQCMSQEVGGAMSLVKQERAERGDCDLDLKVEVNIRAECGLASGGDIEEPSDTVLDTNTTSSSAPPTAQSSSPSSDATMDLTCRPRQRRKAPKPLGGGASVTVGAGLADMVLKPEVPTEDVVSEEVQHEVSGGEVSPERLASLGLDLAWMQERVSHLGAAFAVAQLGLGNADPAHSSASFPTQPGGGDTLEAPPTMLFPGAAHEMAAFAASFDIATAAAAAAGAPPPQPPPPPAPPSTTSTNQRRPYRSGGGMLKEPTVCGVCGRVFPSAAALELHQRVHTGERPFSCPHCGKGFAQPNNLRVHLLIHSGERRYHCSLCGKSFISSSHLKRHRTVHTQEKPYSCSRCGQSFSQMCSVRRHRQQSQCGL